MYPRRRTQRKSEVPRRALVNRSNFQYVVNTEKLQKLANQSGIVSTPSLSVYNTHDAVRAESSTWVEIYATDIVKITSTSVSVLQSLQILLFPGLNTMYVEKWNGSSWDSVFGGTISDKYVLDFSLYYDNTVQFYISQNGGITYYVNSSQWTNGHALIRYKFGNNTEDVDYHYITTELQTN